MNTYRIIGFLLLSQIGTINLCAEDGDIFTTETIEGVEMTFKVISETDKTCQVGRVDGIWAPDHAIPADYEGNVTIPSFANGYHVIRIGRAAFDHCRFKSIVIPSDVETILNEAFNNCLELKTITIPNSMKSIGDMAFNYCTNLKLVKSEIEKPFIIANDVFRNIAPDAKLLVPRGTSELYRNNTSWSKNFIEIEEYIIKFTDAGINYTVVSDSQKTINFAEGEYEQTITVPTSISANGFDWIIVGVDENAFKSSKNISAIIWNPEVTFNGIVSNPNLLLYVNGKKYAGNVKNVIVNGEADEIVLQDAEGGNNFYCPQAFTAKSITYEHNYGMKSGLNVCQGWETIALPFDVTSITNKEGKEFIPHAAWSVGNNQCPFWLYSLSSDGWKAESSIVANTPYLISMPNNEYYDEVYNITGKVIFKGKNVQVKASDNLNVGMKGNKKLVPNYQNQTEDAGIWALNVNNQWSQNTASEVEGSVFIQSLRPVRPFEAYLTVSGSEAARRVIPIFEEGESTGIIDLPLRDDINVDTWFTLDGRKLFTKPTEKGVYINNGKKVLMK